MATAFDEKCSEINRRHELQGSYEKTLALLAALKAGEVSLDQVTLTADGGWTFSAMKFVPAAEVPEAIKELPEAIKERIAGNGTLEGTTETTEQGN